MNTEQISILVVDDNEADRVLYQKLLKRSVTQRYVVDKVESGEECLQWLSDQRCDCILLDYTLPDMYGLDVLQELRNRKNQIPVIMLTGMDCEKIDRKALDLGAVEYLLKDKLSTESLDRVIRHGLQIQGTINALEQSLRVKDDFLAAMSHELKTPLNAIIGFSECLEAGIYGEVSDKQKGILRRLSGAGEHLASIVENILTVSMLQQESVELHPEELDLVEELSFCLSMLKGQADKKKVELTAQCEADCLPMQADKVRLKQIIINLASNAIKFAEGKTVSLTARNVPEGIELRCIDTGIGMTADKLSMIFDPFTQVDGSICRRFGGSGLGLTIVKKLVELHGGTIRVESEPGKGATFIVTLPQALG